MYSLKAVDLDVFEMPADAVAGEEAVVNSVLDPDPVILLMYGFTWQPAVTALAAAARKGVDVHGYFDHIQAESKVEQMLLKELVDAGVKVTIGPSDVGGDIMHKKDWTVLNKPVPVVFTGSTNLSARAFEHQTNDLYRVFSAALAAHQVARYWQLVEFAWAHHADLQIMPAKPAKPAWVGA
jgi:phosphatidylserine/phosphatidylglycerophosphate/cardiolipin synthase-like enzyme